MATTKSALAKRNQKRKATIQWVALAVAAGLAVLAAIVLKGEDPTGTRQNGLAPSAVVAS